MCDHVMHFSMAASIRLDSGERIWQWDLSAKLAGPEGSFFNELEIYMR
jgi:hypothetical protein